MDRSSIMIMYVSYTAGVRHRNLSCQLIAHASEAMQCNPPQSFGTPDFCKWESAYECTPKIKCRMWPLTEIEAIAHNLSSKIKVVQSHMTCYFLADYVQDIAGPCSMRSSFSVFSQVVLQQSGL